MISWLFPQKKGDRGGMPQHNGKIAVFSTKSENFHFSLHQIPKSKVSKSTSRKSGKTSYSYKKKGTVGGTSTRSYFTKYRNLDYKYRIVDYDDQSCPRLLSTYINATDEYISSAVKDTSKQILVKQQFKQYLNFSTYFIPLSTSQVVAKNMSVTIKSINPFSYCIFQNSAQFQEILRKFVITTDYLGQYKDVVGFKAEKATQALNLGYQSDSIYYLCTARKSFQDAPFLSSSIGNVHAGYENTVMWSQLCQKQSTYKEVITNSNNGVYQATVNVYYNKATQFLTGSNHSQPVCLGVNALQTNASINDISSTCNVSDLLDNETFQTIFRPGDMVLCILPCYYLNKTAFSGYQGLNPSVQVCNLVDISIKRHIYKLIQDEGLEQTATNILAREYKKDDPEEKTKTKKSDKPSASSTSNSFKPGQMSKLFNRLVQGIHLTSFDRSEVDDMSQNLNCVVVDANCYDSTNQQLQLTAYMDLNTVPSVQGEQILSSLEGEDTMNCNAIVSAGNSNDQELCYNLTVENTGPKLFQIPESSNVNLTYSTFGVGNSQWHDYYYDDIYVQQSSLTGIVPSTRTWIGTSGTNHTITVSLNENAVLKFVQLIGSVLNIQVIFPKYDWTNNVFLTSAADGAKRYGANIQEGDGYRAIICVLPVDFYFSTTSTDSILTQVTARPSFVLSTGKNEVDQSLFAPPMFYSLLSEFFRTRIFNFYMDGEFYQSQSISDMFDIPESQFTFPDGYTSDCRNFDTYFVRWMYRYISQNQLSASSAWKKFRGFFSKCFKTIVGRVIPVISKVAPAVIPGPYGTVVAAVADAVTNISSTINAIAVKKNSSGAITAMQDDLTVDQFVITPQYRLSDSSVPAPIEQAGTDWIDAESFTVNVDQYGNSVSKLSSNQITQHPLYSQIRQSLRSAGFRAYNTDISTFCQQRIKVDFVKSNVSPEIASGYKAVLAIGSDTHYLADSDFVEVQTE